MQNSEIEFFGIKDERQVQSIQDFSESSNLQSPIIEMKMTQSKLLNLLPRGKPNKCNANTAKTKRRFGVFNTKGTIIFSEEEKERIRKEFIVFSSNRREQISVINKLRVDEKMSKIVNEFDFIPKINKYTLAKQKYDQGDNRELPIYDNLIRKGKEYEIKNNIKRNLEDNLNNDNLTFHPELNPKSIQIAKSHSKVSIDERLYQSQEDIRSIERNNSKENCQSAIYLSEKLKLYQDSLRSNKFELSSEKSNRKSSAKGSRKCSKNRCNQKQ